MSSVIKVPKAFPAAAFANRLPWHSAGSAGPHAKSQGREEGLAR